MEEKKIYYEDNMAEYKSLKERIDTDPTLKMKCIKASKLFKQEFIADSDEKIRYYRATYTMYFSTNFKPYLKKNSDCYVSFNKKTKKLTVVRTSLYGLSKVVRDISELLRMEWFNQFHLEESYKGFPVHMMYSESILEKVWSGEITNPEELVKAYMANIKIKNISWSRTKKFIQFYPHIYIGSLSTILHIIDSFVINPDLFIDKVTHISKPFQGFSDYWDYLTQIAALGIKSNVAYWSEKRFIEEHNKLSMRLMEFELKDKDNTPLFSSSFNKRLPKEINCKFINNELDCFAEGQFMHNCIYTNYWEHIKTLKYFAISINDKVFGRALVGITAFNDGVGVKYILEQIKGPRNTPCSKDLEKIISKWIYDNQEVFNEIRGNIGHFLKEELPILQRDFAPQFNGIRLEEML